MSKQEVIQMNMPSLGEWLRIMVDELKFTKESGPCNVRDDLQHLLKLLEGYPEILNLEFKGK